jgi:hypothetical protein
MIRGRVVVLAVALVGVGTARAATLTAGPYLQQTSEHGFTVVYETSAPAHGLVKVDGKSIATDGTHHEAAVGGLLPGTRHAYEVWLDGAKVAQADARTFPAHEPFTFVVYGDTRQGGAMELAMAERIAAEAPDFVVHTGDLVRKGDDDAAWLELFANERALLQTVPLFPVIGNHEVWGDLAGDRALRHFPELRDGRRYAFTVAGARFIVLDGNLPDAAQTAWLHDELEAAKTARHVFVFVHQPPFSLGDHCGSAPIQRDWVELFERYRVRAVFAGHDHAYEHMERNGIRYFVSGGGGAPLYDEHPCAEWDRAARQKYAAEYHFVRVQVSDGDVLVTAERLDPSRPPIESLRLTSASPSVVAGTPLPAAKAVQPFDRRWTYGAGGIVLLLALSRLFRRRR